MSSFIHWLKKTSVKRRRIIIAVFIIWGLWFFGLGAISSYFLSKGQLAKLPDFNKNDKILILAPHIDDEIIAAGGLIQLALKAGSQIKIVYMTNGDNNPGSVIKESRNLKLSPNEFISLGELRMQEGKNATKILGLNPDNLIFLGYPDQGLLPMLDKFYNPEKPYASKGTEFSYNPYHGTYKNSQVYAGANVVSDFKEIIDNFSPTIVFVSHPRDNHPDHHATFLLLEKALIDNSIKPTIYAYLVHYSRFPESKKLAINQFLYPPKKLYSQEGWYSFNLTGDQVQTKLNAVNQNVSQKEFGQVYDLLQSFVKRNEIFEKLD